LETDANTFASWDVDYVKLDGCYSHPVDMDQGNSKMNLNLILGFRPLRLSCYAIIHWGFNNSLLSYAVAVEKYESHCISHCMAAVGSAIVVTRNNLVAFFLP